MEIFLFSNHYLMPEVLCNKHAQHGKSMTIKGVEKNMDINTKKVRLVKYGNVMRFTTQFIPPFSYRISLEGVR